MHKQWDPIHNSNYKTKLCFFNVLLMHINIFELEKLHMIKTAQIEIGR